MQPAPKSAAERTPRGLQNLGNTCYLNAAVQALAACQPLKAHFDWSSQLLALSSTNEQGEMLSRRFTQVLSELQRPNAPALQPTELIACVRKLSPTLEGTGQQDAEEFLSALLNGVHEHLKRPLSDSELADLRARLSERWLRCTGRKWRDEAQLAYEAQLKASVEPGRMRAAQPPPPPRPQRSVISDLFGGELLSAVTCCGCGETSYTADPYFSLSLPIPTRRVHEATAELHQPGEPSDAVMSDVDPDARVSGGTGASARKTARPSGAGVFSGLMRGMASAFRPGYTAGSKHTEGTAAGSTALPLITARQPATTVFATRGLAATPRRERAQLGATSFAEQPRKKLPLRIAFKASASGLLKVHCQREA